MKLRLDEHKTMKVKLLGCVGILKTQVGSGDRLDKYKNNVHRTKSHEVKIQKMWKEKDVNTIQ